MKAWWRNFLNAHGLLGIVAPIKRIPLQLGSESNAWFQFQDQSQFEIQLGKKKRDYFFSIYEFKVPGCCMTHYLYNNQYEW